MKKVVIVLAALLLVAVSFAAGMYAEESLFIDHEHSCQSD
jgi:hypothetical protein